MRGSVLLVEAQFALVACTPREEFCLKRAHCRVLELLLYSILLGTRVLGYMPSSSAEWRSMKKVALRNSKRTCQRKQKNGSRLDKQLRKENL